MKNQLAYKLTYRKRQSTDDAFLIHTTLEAMQKVFMESTGFQLTEQNIKELINNYETTIVEYEKKPIGYYSYSIYPNKQMYWSSLILVQQIQNQGVGTQIVNHVEQEALARGVQFIDGHVQMMNKRALSFWLKHGFQTIGEPFDGSIGIRKYLTRSR